MLNMPEGQQVTQSAEETLPTANTMVCWALDGQHWKASQQSTCKLVSRQRSRSQQLLQKLQITSLSTYDRHGSCRMSRNRNFRTLLLSGCVCSCCTQSMPSAYQPCAASSAAI